MITLYDPLPPSASTRYTIWSTMLNSITDYCRTSFDQSHKSYQGEMKSASWGGEQDVHMHIVIQLYNCQYSEQKFALSSKYPKASSLCMSLLSNRID